MAGNKIERLRASSEITKARAAASMSRIREGARSMVADLRGKNAQKIKDLRATYLAANAGALAGAAVAGQVARLDPWKNAEGIGKGMLINYGVGAIGFLMLFRAKSRTQIVAAGTLTGFATGQMAIDSSKRDWWPFAEPGDG